MAPREFLFTSESVTEGHPDKIADQVSDTGLDAVLRDDVEARCACETLITTGLVVVAGEISTETYVDIPKIVRGCIADIGYTNADFGIDAETCGVVTSIQEQSGDIAQGVEAAYEVDEHGRQRPVAIERLLVSAQHMDGVDIETLIKPDIIEHVLQPILPPDLYDANRLIHDRDFVLVNPTGKFVVGGPKADTGLTGRKIMIDTYGGAARHGGGCFSGKDPTKVDRSAAYACRYIAKNVVAAGLAERLQLQVAYAIGTAHPVSLNLEPFGTAEVDPQRLEDVVREMFDFRPAAIMRDLDLRRPIYRETAAYGHFGRKEFSWEKTDRADDLRRAFD